LAKKFHLNIKEIYYVSIKDTSILVGMLKNQCYFLFLNYHPYQTYKAGRQILKISYSLENLKIMFKCYISLENIIQNLIKY
jgi:hypothetical protein